MSHVRRVYHSIERPNGTIAACCHLPDDQIPGGLGIVFLHADYGCKLGANNLFVCLSDNLAREGILCFRFDYLGCGESTDATDLTVGSAAGDTETAIEYLCSMYDVRRLVLVSMCFGSIVMFRAKYPVESLCGVILLSPPPILLSPRSGFELVLLRFWQKLRSKVWPGVCKEALEEDVSGLCRAVDGRRILVLLGTADLRYGEVHACYRSLVDRYAPLGKVVSLPGMGVSFPLLAAKAEILRHVRAFVVGEALAARVTKSE